MSNIPKYAVVPEGYDDSELLEYVATGETPEEAAGNFAIDTLESFVLCEHVKSEFVTLKIYTTCKPEDSDWPEEERNPNWKWVCDEERGFINLSASRL